MRDINGKSTWLVKRTDQSLPPPLFSLHAPPLASPQSTHWHSRKILKRSGRQKTLPVRMLIHRLWHVLLFETAVRHNQTTHTHWLSRTLHLSHTHTHRQTLAYTHSHVQTPVSLIIWQQGAHCAVLWLCRAACHPEGRNIFKSKAYPCQSKPGYHKPTMWGLEEYRYSQRAC